MTNKPDELERVARARYEHRRMKLMPELKGSIVTWDEMTPDEKWPYMDDQAAALRELLVVLDRDMVEHGEDDWVIFVGDIERIIAQAEPPGGEDG